MPFPSAERTTAWYGSGDYPSFPGAALANNKKPRPVVPAGALNAADRRLAIAAA